MADGTKLTAHNKMYRKTGHQIVQKNSWTGNMHCSRDAGANDMIHMGSDHRSVMAQFVITAPKKGSLTKKRTAPRGQLTQQRLQRAKMTKKKKEIR